MNLNAIIKEYGFDNAEEIENGLRVTVGGEVYEAVYHELERSYTADQDGISLCHGSSLEETLDFIEQFSGIGEDPGSYSVKRYIVYCKEIGEIVGTYDTKDEAYAYIQEEHDAIGEVVGGGLAFEVIDLYTCDRVAE